MESKKTVYMIRRKSDGLFSSGGMEPTFTKKGKVWNGLGALKNHLNLATENYYSRDRLIHVNDSFSKYTDCEIVSLEIVQKESDEKTFDITEYLIHKLEERAAKEIEWYPNKPVQIKYPDGSIVTKNPINDNSV